MKRAILVMPLLALTVSIASTAFADNHDGSRYKPDVSTTETTSAAIDPREIVTTKPPPERVRIDTRFGVEPLIGYGSSNWNFGAGGRIGYTFPLPFWVGGTFVWYSGDTDQTASTSAITERKTNYYYAGLETGYDIALARGLVMVRPYGGTAILYTRTRISAGGNATANADDQALIYPGLTAHFNLPDAPVFVGADNRFLISLEQGKASYQVFLTVGLSL